MTVSRATLNGWFKRRYGKKNDALPSWAIVQNLIQFSEQAKIGDAYVAPVFLRRSHGVTVKGGASRGTSYTLNAARSGQSEMILVQGSEITLRDEIGWGTVAAAAGGKSTAYGSVVDNTVFGLAESHRFYLEVGALYGQTSIAEIETQTGSGTTRTFKITKKSWAPGLWSQSEGAILDAYDNPGGTQLNPDAVIEVTGVNAKLRQISVSGDATDLDACVAGSKLMFALTEGEFFAGLDKVMTNEGELHGIDAATYSLWKSNVHDAGGGPLTMSILHAATTDAVVRGLKGKFTWIVNTYSWQNLVDDEGALRRHAGESNSEYKTGAKSITFAGANGDDMDIVPHPMVKAGEAFGVKEDTWIRGGESDLVDQIPGMPEEIFFHHVPGKTGAEVLNFSSQFFLCQLPAQQVKIENISPTGLA